MYNISIHKRKSTSGGGRKYVASVNGSSPVDKLASIVFWRWPSTLNCGSDTSAAICKRIHQKNAASKTHSLKNSASKMHSPKNAASKTLEIFSATASSKIKVSNLNALEIFVIFGHFDSGKVHFLKSPEFSVFTLNLNQSANEWMAEKEICFKTVLHNLMIKEELSRNPFFPIFPKRSKNLDDKLGILTQNIFLYLQRDTVP